MATATSSFFRDTAFDPFLFAAIGEERNGMFLSVVSALARLDLDPWREAASLSKLPPAAATERLSSLLSSLPSSQLALPAPAAIARLVGLLPKAAKEVSWSPGPDVIKQDKMRMPLPMVAILVLALIMICAAQFAQRREITAPIAAGASHEASTPPAPSKPLGQ